MAPLTTLPEQELLRRLRAGDEQAFTEIYNRYWEKLLAVGYYHTRDKQAAEDIVHEVMLSLWTRKSELQIDSLPTYLATAVKFSVFKAITRDKKRRAIREGLAGPEQVSDIEEKLDARFLREYLDGVVEQLPEKARLVFHYSRNEGLTVADIAGKMDLSPKSVEYHITKALRALRESLEKIKSFFV